MTANMNRRVVILAALVIVGVSAVIGVALMLLTGESGTAPETEFRAVIIGEPVSIELPAQEAATVTHESGARIEIPAGATIEPTTVSVAEVEPPISTVPVGRVFDFSVGDAQLLGAVTVHIPFDLEEGQDPKQFTALHWLEEHATWEELQGEINESQQTIAVSVSDLSWFSTVFADWDCPRISGDSTPDIVPRVLEVRLVSEAPMVGDDIEVEYKVANAGSHCLSSVDGTGQVFLTSPGQTQSRGKLQAARVGGDKWKPGIAMPSTKSNGGGGDSDDALAFFTVEDAEPGRQEFRVELVFWDEDGKEIGRHDLSKEVIVARGPELALTYVRVEADRRDFLSWVEGTVGEDGAIVYTVSPDWADELLKQKAIYTALASRELQSWHWHTPSYQRNIQLGFMEYGEYLVFGSKLALNALIVAFSPNLYSKARAFVQIPVDILLKWKELNSPGTAKTITGAVALEIGHQASALMLSNERLVERVKGRSSRESGGLMTFAEALEFKNNQFYDDVYWDPVRLTAYNIKFGGIANWNDESDFLMAKAALVPFEHFFAGKVLSEAVEVVAVASLLGGLDDALRDYSPWNQMVSETHGNLIDQRAAYTEFLDGLGIEDHEPFQLPVLTQIDIPHYRDLDVIDSQAPTPISTPDPPPPVVVSPAPSGTDRDALIALYNATDGPNWKNTDDLPWLTEDSNSAVGGWHGVTVHPDDATRVWFLQLRWNCLRGELPSSIGNLTFLNTLFLTQNKAPYEDNPSACGNLEGTIPDSLGNLTNLDLLDLSDNNLSGAIPSELGNTQSILRELYLANNRLTGEIPSSIGKLSNLYVLDLSGNRLRGEIPQELTMLTKLEELKLSGGRNEFTGCIPKALFYVEDHDLNELELDPCGDGEEVIADMQPALDLVVVEPSVSHSEPSPGDHFTLSATVGNVGNGDSLGSTLRFYRSTDDTIDKRDSEVGLDAVGMLGASDSSIESISLTAPSDAGTYYYGACVYSWLAESDTNNNCSSGVKVTVSVVPQMEFSITATADQFTSVSAGGEHTCGVLTVGSVVCWGANETGQATPPIGQFFSVSAGVEHTCALKTDGSIACWGANDYGMAKPPDGEFVSVSAGSEHTCGVLTDGSVTCWGRSSWGLPTPQDGVFISVSAGVNHTCGVLADQSVACWGGGRLALPPPPEGQFTSVTAGWGYACGLRIDGFVACWGSNVSQGQDTPSDGTFASISAPSTYYGRTCGVRIDGSVACWRLNNYRDVNLVVEVTPPNGQFASVSAGGSHNCGIKVDGSVVCWGKDNSGQASPPDGQFISVSARSQHICGLREDGSVSCWGGNDVGQVTPAEGEFIWVSVGRSHTYGIRTDGSFAFWGKIPTGWSSPSDLSVARFTSISTSEIHTCGLRTDGSIACWGHDRYGQVASPAGQFLSVSTGSGHTCALKTDGSIACWGANDYGMAKPPDGEFISVSAGRGHTCGVKADNSVECWGSNEDWRGNVVVGQATPPNGEFASVSAGVDHTCGVRTDGSVECWGDDEFGKATAPDGKFVSVSAGGSHTCGVNNDGYVVCWGSQARGLTSSEGR